MRWMDQEAMGCAMVGFVYGSGCYDDAALRRHIIGRDRDAEKCGEAGRQAFHMRSRRGFESSLGVVSM